MINMFLAYVANISDNLHTFASTALFIGCFLFLWSWMPVSFNDGSTIFEKYVKPHLKEIALAIAVLFVVFLFTPSNWRHEMDMQYIQENSKLRSELNDITIQLNACEMKRGKYARYDE